MDNIAEKVNHGITLISSKLTMRNTTVDYSEEGIKALELNKVDTGVLNLNF